MDYSKLKSIKKACNIGDKVFSEVIANFSRFNTEKDIERFIYSRFKTYKVRKAFPPIIASGKNAAEPHHKPTDKRINKGFCVIDLGCRVNGYCSDMTRTVFIGNPSKKERGIYTLVLKVQKKSMKNVKIGEMYKDIDISSRKMLGKKKKYFIHSLGHGVGKWIHMKPKISPKSIDVVKVGDIITIEPGIYIKEEYGIRIEDTLVIKDKTIEVLTKSNKKFIII